MSDRLTTEYADLVNIYNKEQNFIRQNDSILPVIHIAWLYNKNVEIIDAPASEYKLPKSSIHILMSCFLLIKLLRYMII